MQLLSVSKYLGKQWQEFDLHWMMGQGCVCTFEIELSVEIGSELNKSDVVFLFSWN